MILAGGEKGEREGEGLWTRSHLARFVNPSSPETVEHGGILGVLCMHPLEALR